MRKLNLLALSFACLCLFSCGNNPAPSSSSSDASSSSATSTKDTFLVKCSSGEGGSISANKTSGKSGDSVTVSYAVNDGYAFDYVTLNGEKLSSLSFTIGNDDCYLFGYFHKLDQEYSIDVEPNAFGVINVSANKAKYGEEISLDYVATYGYVLESFFINGEPLGKVSSFAMKGYDITISASFIPAIEDTPYSVSVKVTNLKTTSYWYAYAYEEYVEVIAKVNDQSIIKNGELKYQDYAQCMFSFSSSSSWIANRTFALSVTVSGEAFIRKALSKTTLSDEIYDLGSTGIAYSATRKCYAKNEGYDGYEVSMRVPYKYLGLEGVEDALMSLRLCPAIHDQEGYLTSFWGAYGDWFSVSSYFRPERGEAK